MGTGVVREAPACCTICDYCHGWCGLANKGCDVVVGGDCGCGLQCCGCGLITHTEDHPLQGILGLTGQPPRHLRWEGTGAGQEG